MGGEAERCADGSAKSNRQIDGSNRALDLSIGTAKLRIERRSIEGNGALYATKSEQGGGKRKRRREIE